MAETWAGVIRVSHMGGRIAGSDNVHTDRDQIAAIQARAALEGARVVMLPLELDVSGGLPLEQRPSLLAAIEGVEAGEYQAIVVAYLSRLGRNVREQLKAWDRVEAAGGRIICAAENLDTSTSHGRFLRTVLLANAEREREEHADRFEQLREHATRAGVWQRRQTPLGYDRDPTTRRLIPNRDAGRVRAIYTAKIRGDSIASIARKQRMTTAGIRHLLRNRVYLGELTVGKHTNPAAHPPIIEPAVFQAAQQFAARPTRGQSSPSLLTGLIVCAGCDRPMSPSARRSTYSCRVLHSGGACPQPAAISQHLANNHVEAFVRELLDGITLQGTPATSQHAAELAEATAELDAWAHVSVADLGPDAYRAGALVRRERVRAAEQAMRAHGARTTITGALQAWDSLTIVERQHVLRGLLSRVVVRKAGRGGRPDPAGRIVIVLVDGLVNESVAGRENHA